MLPWMDFALAGIILWETISGYVFGLKTAIVRICVMLAAFLVSVPLAPNCTAYLRPVFAQTIKASIAARAAEASSGFGIFINLGPWQGILGIPTAADPGAYINSVLELSLNVISLSFLLIVIIAAFRLMEPKSAREPQAFGAAAGFAEGVITVLVILVLIPVLAVGKQGQLFVSALETSWTAHLFEQAVQVIVSQLAFYV